MGNGQMNYQHYLEEICKDLLDIMLGLLERWKCVIASGIILAILLPCAVFLKDLRAYSNEMMDVEELLTGGSNLTRDLEAPAIKALSYYSQYNAKRKYFRDSNITDIEGTEENRFTLLYYIRTEDDKTDAASIAKMYAVMASDRELQAAMANALGMKATNEYVKELYYYTVQNDQTAGSGQEGASFTFTVILPRETSADKIEGVVTSYLDSKKDAFSKQVGSYSVDLVTSFFSTVDNQTRIDSQIEYYKKLAAAETSFISAYKHCNAKEKSLVRSIIYRDIVDTGVRKLRRGDVDELLEELKRIEPVFPTEEEMDSDILVVLAESEGMKPSFPLLDIPVGLMGGMILFAALYIVLAIIDRYVRNASGMKRATGLRSFGEIYEYPYRTGLQKFAHDRKVYKFRHRESGNPAGEITRIADRLAAKAEHLQIPGVTFIVLGAPSGRQEIILKKQTSSILEKKTIDVQYVVADKGVKSIDEGLFNRMPAVFIVFLSGKTTYNMAQHLLDRLKEYDVSMIGTELLESE